MNAGSFKGVDDASSHAAPHSTPQVARFGSRKKREGMAGHSWKPSIGLAALVVVLAILAPSALWGQEASSPSDLFRRVGEGDESALTALRKAAESGDPESQFQLGRAYSFGGPILKRDDTAAAEWVEKAADQGHGEAQSNMGYLYSQGLGVPKDPAKAVSWWQRSAERGFAQAQFNLAIAYLEGKLVSKDEPKAFLWMSRAAAQGANQAQVNLGLMYGRGIGTKVDLNEAMNWYRKAAEQGNEIAMTNIGSMYANGEAVPKDPAEALRWLEKPVARGNPRAVSIRNRICAENAGLCKPEAPDKTFAFEMSDPRFRVVIPSLPAISMAVHPSHASKPHLRYLGANGPYTVSILAPTADAGMTARDCAVSEFKKLESVPGIPPPDKVYKAKIDDNTFVAIYAMPMEGTMTLHAHLISAAGGTHCIQVHASKTTRSKDDMEPWWKAFGNAKFEPN